MTVEKRDLSLRGRLRRLWFSDPAPAEFASALAALAWGIGLAAPGETFAARPEFYEPMAALAGEQAWAGIFFALGLAQIFALLSTHRCQKFCRLTVGMMAIFVWSFLSATVSMRWPPAAASMPHLVLAAMAWWAFARLGDRPNGPA